MAACDDDATETYYLGAVDAAAATDAAPPDVAVDSPALSSLASTPCAIAPIGGPDPLAVVRSVAALQSRLIVASHDAVLAFALGTDACPTEPIAAFGQNGRVAIAAVSAAPLPAGRAIITMSDRTLLLDSDGSEAGTCLSENADVRVRWIASNGDGHALGVFVRSPLLTFATDLGAPASCEVAPLELPDQPLAVLAVAPAPDGQSFVAVEQQTTTGPLALARYDLTGTRIATSTTLPYPLGLCSASGLVVTDDSVVVADGACGRVVAFDGASLAPNGEAQLDGAPRGLAWPGGNRVLTAVARATLAGAEARFVSIELPAR